MDLEYEFDPMTRFRSYRLYGLLVAFLAIGCQRQNEITRYSVPREPSTDLKRAVEPLSSVRHPDAPAGGPERMLAAIIPG
jgi:hypothetical protein